MLFFITGAEALPNSSLGADAAGLWAPSSMACWKPALSPAWEPQGPEPPAPRPGCQHSATRSKCPAQTVGVIPGASILAVPQAAAGSFCRAPTVGRLPGRAGLLTVPRPWSTTLPTVLLKHAHSPSLGRMYKHFLPQNGKPVVPNEQLSFRLGEEGVRRGRSLPAALLQDLMLGVHGSSGAPCAQHSTFSYCGKKHMT